MANLAAKLGQTILTKTKEGISDFGQGMKGAFISANPAVFGPAAKYLEKKLTKDNKNLKTEKTEDRRLEKEKEQRSQGFFEENFLEDRKMQQDTLLNIVGINKNTASIDRTAKEILELLKKCCMCNCDDKPSIPIPIIPLPGGVPPRTPGRPGPARRVPVPVPEEMRRPPSLPDERLPRGRVPEIETPRYRPPFVELPRVRVPELDLPRVRVPELDLPRVRVPAIETPPRYRPPVLEGPPRTTPFEEPRFRPPALEEPRYRPPALEAPRVPGAASEPIRLGRQPLGLPAPDTSFIDDLNKSLFDVNKSFENVKVSVSAVAEEVKTFSSRVNELKETFDNIKPSIDGITGDGATGGRVTGGAGTGGGGNAIRLPSAPAGGSGSMLRLPAPGSGAGMSEMIPRLPAPDRGQFQLVTEGAESSRAVARTPIPADGVTDIAYKNLEPGFFERIRLSIVNTFNTISTTFSNFLERQIVSVSNFISKNFTGTSLFGGLTGEGSLFAKLNTLLEPIKNIVNPIFESVKSTVIEYGGKVIRFLGSTLFAWAVGIFEGTMNAFFNDQKLAGMFNTTESQLGVKERLAAFVGGLVLALPKLAIAVIADAGLAFTTWIMEKITGQKIEYNFGDLTKAITGVTTKVAGAIIGIFTLDERMIMKSIGPEIAALRDGIPNFFKSVGNFFVDGINSISESLINALPDSAFGVDLTGTKKKVKDATRIERFGGPSTANADMMRGYLGITRSTKELGTRISDIESKISSREAELSAGMETSYVTDDNAGPEGPQSASYGKMSDSRRGSIQQEVADFRKQLSTLRSEYEISRIVEETPLETARFKAKQVNRSGPVVDSETAALMNRGASRGESAGYKYYQDTSPTKDRTQDPAFYAKVLQVSNNLGVDPKELLAVMAFESGINPAILNKAGSGAAGLIQFMPDTAKALGTTTEELVKMNATEQLDYVEKYYKMVGLKAGSTLGDIYLKTFLPVASNWSSEKVMGERGGQTVVGKTGSGRDLTTGMIYAQNQKAFDPTGKGFFTKEDVVSIVNAKGYSRLDQIAPEYKIALQQTETNTQALTQTADATQSTSKIQESALGELRQSVQLSYDQIRQQELTRIQAQEDARRQFEEYRKTEDEKRKRLEGYENERRRLQQQFDSQMQGIFRPMVDALKGPNNVPEATVNAGKNLSKFLKDDFSKLGVTIFGKQYGAAIGGTFQELAGVYMNEFVNEALAPALGMKSETLNRAINTYVKGVELIDPQLKQVNESLAKSKAALEKYTKETKGISTADIVRAAGKGGFSAEQQQKIAQLTAMREDVKQKEAAAAALRSQKKQYKNAALEDMIFGMTGIALGPRTMLDQYAGGAEGLTKDLASFFGAPFNPAFGLNDKDALAYKKLEAESKLYQGHVQGQATVMTNGVNGMGKVLSSGASEMENAIRSAMSDGAGYVRDAVGSVQIGGANGSWDILPAAVGDGVKSAIGEVLPGGANGSWDILPAAVGDGVKSAIGEVLPTFMGFEQVAGGGTSIPGYVDDGSYDRAEMARFARQTSSMGPSATGWQAAASRSATGGRLMDFGQNMLYNMLGSKVSSAFGGGMTGNIFGRAATGALKGAFTGGDIVQNIGAQFGMKLAPGAGIGDLLGGVSNMFTSQITSMGSMFTNLATSKLMPGFMSQGVMDFGTGMQAAGGGLSGMMDAFGSGNISHMAGAAAGGLMAGLQGYGISKALSGGYSTGGNTVNLLAGIGSAFFGPIAGVVGGLVNRAFGRKAKETKAQGFSGTFSTEGADVKQFTDWFQKGGWFRSNKSGTDFKAVDSETAKAFSDTVKDTTKTVEALAKSLGYDPTKTKGFSKAVKIDLKGLDEKQQQEAIQKAFKDYGASLVGASFKTVGKFTKEGEDQLDTLSRLANASQVFKSVMTGPDVKKILGLDNADTIKNLVTKQFTDVTNMDAAIKDYMAGGKGMMETVLGGIGIPDLFGRKAGRYSWFRRGMRQGDFIDYEKDFASLPAELSTAFGNVFSGLNLDPVSGVAKDIVAAFTGSLQDQAGSLKEYLDTYVANFQSELIKAYGGEEEFQKVESSLFDLLYTEAEKKTKIQELTAARMKDAAQELKDAGVAIDPEKLGATFAENQKAAKTMLETADKDLATGKITKEQYATIRKSANDFLVAAKKNSEVAEANKSDPTRKPVTADDVRKMMYPIQTTVSDVANTVTNTASSVTTSISSAAESASENITNSSVAGANTIASSSVSQTTALEKMIEEFIRSTPTLSKAVADTFIPDSSWTAPMDFGGGGAAGVGGSDGMARGGWFRKKRPMIVGEVGPEVMVPNFAGTIVPTHKIIEAVQNASALDSQTRNLLLNAAPAPNPVSVVYLDQENANKSLNRDRDMAQNVNNAVVDNSVTQVSSPQTTVINGGGDVRSTHPISGMFTRAMIGARGF